MLLPDPTHEAWEVRLLRGVTLPIAVTVPVTTPVLVRLPCTGLALPVAVGVGGEVADWRGERVDPALAVHDPKDDPESVPWEVAVDVDCEDSVEEGERVAPLVIVGRGVAEE